MTPESQKSSLLSNGSVNRFHGNEHAHNNRRTAASIQRRGKHTSITIEELLGSGVFCWGRPDAI
jgi:hypothetical protein